MKRTASGFPVAQRSDVDPLDLFLFSRGYDLGLFDTKTHHLKMFNSIKTSLGDKPGSFQETLIFDFD